MVIVQQQTVSLLFLWSCFNSYVNGSQRVFEMLWMIPNVSSMQLLRKQPTSCQKKSRNGVKHIMMQNDVKHIMMQNHFQVQYYFQTCSSYYRKSRNPWKSLTQTFSQIIYSYIDIIVQSDILSRQFLPSDSSCVS